MEPTEILKIAQDRYGDNCWMSDYHLYILYPEVTIRNRNGNTHLIRDLVVDVPFSSSYNFINDIRGARLTFTDVEYVHKYCHSHLSGGDRYGSFTNFCLGSSPLNYQLNDIRASKLTEDNFEMMLTILDRYVTYESLEGGPYRYFKDLSATPSTSSVPSVDNREWLNAINFLNMSMGGSFEFPGSVFMSSRYTQLSVSDSDITQYVKNLCSNTHFVRYMHKLGTPIATVYYRPQMAIVNDSLIQSISNTTIDIGGRKFKAELILTAEKSKRKKPPRVINPSVINSLKTYFKDGFYIQRASVIATSKNSTFKRIC